MMKGWYIPVHSEEPAGERTAWHASFWGPCDDYLKARLAINGALLLSVHCGNWNVPGQLLIRTPKGGNKQISLLPKTSIMDTHLKLPDRKDMEIKEKLRAMTLAAALIACSPVYYSHNAIEARAALSTISDECYVNRRRLSMDSYSA